MNYGSLSQQYSVSETSSRLIQPQNKQTPDILNSSKSPGTILTTQSLTQLSTSHVITGFFKLIF